MEKANGFDLKSVRSSSTARDGWTRDERLIKAPYDKIESSRGFIAQSMKLIEDFVDPELKKTIRRINARAFEQTQTYASRTLPLKNQNFFRFRRLRTEPTFWRLCSVIHNAI